MSSRFPFEEDWRRRFGEFHELVPRYIAIGPHPVTGPRAKKTRNADPPAAQPQEANRTHRAPPAAPSSRGAVMTSGLDEPF